MKLFLTSIFLLLTFLIQTPAALADVILNIPDDLRVVAINGENSDVTMSTTLANGLNQVVVYFEDEIGRPFDEPELERSDAFVILFRAENSKLTLQKGEIKSISQLEEFNKKPSFTLINQNGKSVTFDIDKLEKEGFQLGRNYQQELMVFNASESPAALMNPTLISRKQNHLPAAKSGIQQPAASNNSNMAEVMLKYWYQQADDTTRSNFRIWIEDK
jgi:uncharacterized protein YccT (UPF0319 family)